MSVPVRLYIDPPSHHFLRDRLFDRGAAKYGGDDLLAPHVHLRDWFEERGLPVHTADRLLERDNGADRAVYVSFGMLDKYEELASRPEVTVSAFFGFECPIVEPSMYRELPRAQRFFRRLFSWTDASTLLRFTGTPVRVERFWWPQSFDRVHDPLWRRTGRRFLVMINANKLPRVYWNELYTERMRAVEFFSRTGEIDLYGKGWGGPSMRVGRTRVPYTVKRIFLAGQRAWDRVRPAPRLVSARRAWKGAAESKSDVLSQYTFALCFENATLPGWITEKIFDCFFAGTVPVYWGAPDVADYIPAETFIDMRRFGGYEDLRRYLHELSPGDVGRYRQAAREFVESAAFGRFSRQAFTDRIARIVAEDAGWDGLGARITRDAASARVGRESNAPCTRSEGGAGERQ
jgi:hypothetical protein